MSLVEIGAVIICDDVRKENTNKDILIGVYSGDIILPSFPSELALAIWIELIPKQIGEHELEFRLSLAGQQLATFMLKATVPKLGSSSTAIPGFRLGVAGETELLLEIREGHDWRVLKRKKIVQGNVTSTFLSPTLQSGQSGNL